VWKGLSTIAGSWIGGANQTAMLEVFMQAAMFPDDCCRCTSCQFMDGVLLYGAQKNLTAELEKKLEEEQAGKRNR
jgi:hypothetical protein